MNSPHTPAPARTRPALEPLEDRAVPAALNPVYAATFDDAVTADNAFAGQDGKRYWTVDPGADRYQTDDYERPTAQTYKFERVAGGGERFAASEYYQNLDIVRGRAGFDATHLYVSTTLAGLDKLTADGSASREGLTYRYGFRLAKQADGGGGHLVVADQPQFKNAPGQFGRVGVMVHRDANGDVGGTGLDVTKQDRPAEVGGNGYERVVAADGRASSGRSVAWVRVSPADPTTVEFAVDYRALGYTATDLGGLAFLRFEANKGLQDPGNYAWNDEYTKSEAGSPYGGASGTRSEFGTQGLGNVYELDTLAGGPLASLRPASISGYVYMDTNSDGQRDAGEDGVYGVTVTLTGVDDQGQSVFFSVDTDANGFYQFGDLRPGTYTLTEAHPDDLVDGAESVGTVNGVVTGEAAQGEGQDEITSIVLAAGDVGVEYNFGEELLTEE